MVMMIEAELTGFIEGTDNADFFIGDPLGIRDATILAEAGNDFIVGRNTSEGGVGIAFTTIDAGDGEDLLIGQATGAGGVGILRSVLILGDGDDYLLATGEAAGIRDTIIDGGRGNDRFVINGFESTGTIIGGKGEDTGVLPGDIEDYKIIPIDPIGPFIEVNGFTEDNLQTSLVFSDVEFIDFVNPDTGLVQTLDVLNDVFLDGTA